jgi:WD40 repeat protein
VRLRFLFIKNRMCAPGLLFKPFRALDGEASHQPHSGGAKSTFSAAEGLHTPLLDMLDKGDAATALAFSSEGDALGVAIGGRALLFGRQPGEGRAKAWSQIGKPIDPGNGTVSGLALVGRVVVTGVQEGDVTAWPPLESEWQRRSLGRHGGLVWSLSASRDLRRVLSSSDDGSVRMTYTYGGFGRHFSGHQGRVVTSALSPDGLLAATGGLDGHVRLWPTAAGRQGLHHAGPPIRSVAVEDPAKLIIGGLEDGRLALWQDARASGTLSQGSLAGGVRGLCMLPRNRIVAGSVGGAIVTLDADGQVAHSARANESVGPVLCKPDGTVVTGHDHSVQVRRPGADDFLLVGGHEREVVSLALAPNGHTVVSGSMDNHVRLWDLDAASAPPLVPRQLAEYDAGAWVTAVAALDVRDILFGTVDGRLRRWHRDTGRVERLAPDHHAGLMAIAVRGGLVATAGEDGLLLRWLDDGASRPLRGHVGVVTSTLFSRDGDSLVSGGGDGTVRVWPLPPRDRRGFAAWLAARAPWSILNGVLQPNPIPKFEELAGAPSPRLDPACISKCRALKADGTLSKAGETMESCVLIDMCNGHDGN